MHFSEISRIVTVGQAYGKKGHQMKLRISTALCCATTIVFAMSDAMAAKFTTKLFLSADGLALSAFPSSSNLQQAITVSRTQGSTQVTWNAVSDKPWLSVTASGLTGESLTVEADPNQVKNNHMNVAKVTVSTSGGDFSDTETLYVGFWVGSRDPLTPIIVQQSGTTIAANPVTPVVYVSDGGSTVNGYNVYSGKLTETFNTGAGKIGATEVSSNGQILFAFDTKNRDVIALSTNTGKQIASYAVGNSFLQNMVYARPFGQQALYLSGGPILSVPKGEVLATGLSNGQIAVTPDGQRLYAVDVGIDPATLSNYSVGISGNALTITPIKSRLTSGENCEDLAVSHDGAHVYPACGAPYEFDVYDGNLLKKVQKLRAVPYPNNIEVDENDNAVGGLAFSYQKDDVYIYDQAGKTIAKVAADQSAMQNGDLKVSGDGTRVMVLTSSTLNIRTIP